MNVYVPLTLIHDPTFEALWAAGINPQVRMMDERDAYWRLLKELWGGPDFIICEHDVIPTRAQLASLGAFEPDEPGCPNGWCSVTEAGIHATFSLVRFRTEYMRANGDTWEEMGRQNRITIHQPLWTMLDTWIMPKSELGYGHTDRPPCEHSDPPVVNARPDKATVQLLQQW